MLWRSPLLLLMVPVLVSAAPSESSTGSASTTAVRYELIEEPGALYVLTKPASLLGFLAHRHVVEARGFDGHVLYDSISPQECTIEVNVPVAGLIVDRSELRKQLELKKEISDKNRAKADKHMRAEKQLNGSKHSHIRFRATGCVPQEPAGKFLVKGSLQIRGYSHTLQVPVLVRFLDGALEIESDFIEVHESFGFKPYSAFGGMIKNASELQFRVRLRARKVD